MCVWILKSLVLEHIAEVEVGCDIGFVRGHLGSTLVGLAPTGTVFVVGVVNSVLDPQSFCLLHVRTFLCQRHGFPGLTYRASERK